MKIAVVGIGVAGAYILARLKNQHEVVGFERSTPENHDSICAWGTSKVPMQEFSKKVDLDFNDYVKRGCMFRSLPLEKYPNGKMFYDNTESLKNSSIIVHFNWVQGHLKMAKMKEHKLWLLTPEEEV